MYQCRSKAGPKQGKNRARHDRTRVRYNPKVGPGQVRDWAKAKQEKPSVNGIKHGWGSSRKVCSKKFVQNATVFGSKWKVNVKWMLVNVLPVLHNQLGKLPTGC